VVRFVNFWFRLPSPAEYAQTGGKGADEGNMTTWITICDTCKREDWDESCKDQTDGAALAALIETAAQGTMVRTRRVSCLMGCGKGCNVVVQAPGKLSYTLGGFEPDRQSAQAIVEYSIRHAESTTGQVPFRQWPAAIKGHFVSRHPPLPSEE